MKRLPAYYYAIVLIVGAVITRECASGFLKPAEQAWNTWLQEVSVPHPQPRVTLVTAEDAPELLTPLDAALFLRAAMQFGAGVAAIATAEIDRGEEELLRSVLARDTATAFVGGALLSPDPHADAVSFLPAPWAVPNALPEYPGVWNNLPAVPEMPSGFLNLPENSENGGLPLFARWQGRVVPSFSLACLLRFLEVNGVNPLPAWTAGSLRFSNQCRLPVSPAAEAALQPSAYSEIIRINLGDLLVAAEKGERNSSESDPAIVAAIQDRIVVLALAPTAEELAAGRLTLGQFQALGIASLAAQLRLPTFGPWVWGIPFLWFFPWLKLMDAWRQNRLPVTLLLLGIYALAALTLAAAAGLLLPGIPALAWALALAAAGLLRQKSEPA